MSISATVIAGMSCRTHPRAEVKAVVHLARQGFETYLPRYLKKRRHARRVETVEAPLFPSLSVRCGRYGDAAVALISSTFGVTHLVCNGDDPAPIADDIIDALRDREDETWAHSSSRAPSFATGDKVRLLDGAFVDCIGLFEGMKDIERVSVLLDLLGRKVRVLLDARRGRCRLTAGEATVASIEPGWAISPGVR